MSDRDLRLAQLRDRVRTRSAMLPPYADELVRAMLDDADGEITHADCLAALPSYVDAELDGANVARKFPATQKHLLVCDGCAAQYIELLELTLAEQARIIPDRIRTAFV